MARNGHSSDWHSSVGPSSGRCTARLDVDTSLGLARAHYDAQGTKPVGRLLLGHGAGGGVEAKDLLTVRDAAVAAGWAVVRVEQPWRVAGKRVAAPPPRLDTAWLEVAAALAADGSLPFDPATPLVIGGRSAGARVACRTATALRADGVLCLAFPLHPPGKPERSRAHELALAGGVPLLVVQGERDPFGSPDDVRAHAPAGTQVVDVAGDHGLSRDVPAVTRAAGTFLAQLLARLTGSSPE